MRAVHEGFDRLGGRIAMTHGLGDGDHLSLKDPRRFFGPVSAGTLRKRRQA